MSQYKKVIKEEFIKCAKDPVYFMRKYCWIQHPTRGRTQFNLYPFQEETLKLLYKHDKAIILKSRQLGISTLSGGMALHMMLFNKDKNILVIATKQETAKNLVTKVKFMYDELPSWLKIPHTEKNRLSLRLTNGSQIKAVSAAGDAGRSEAVSLLVIDEGAFIEENRIEEIWGSSQQTLSTGGKAIILSTPNGVGNWFHRMWTRAHEPLPNGNGFTPIRLPWTVHPERDQSWRDLQDNELGVKMALQECDCDFTTSGNTVYDSDFLNFIEKTTLKDPLEKRGIDQNYWIWEYPDYSRKYMVVADVARGDGADYSTFHVLDVEDCKQVATFKSQISTKEFGKMLVVVATEYNNALLVVENANIGWAAIQPILDSGYPNLYYSPKEGKILDANAYLSKGYDLIDKSKMAPGFTMSTRTRPLCIGKLDAYLRDRSLVIQDRRTLEELRTFVWKNGKAEAQVGYNDDLVMALAIGCYVRDTALQFAQQGIDLTKAMLNSMNKVDYNPIKSSNYNPNKMQNTHWNPRGRGEEDLSWLL